MNHPAKDRIHRTATDTPSPHRPAPGHNRRFASRSLFMLLALLLTTAFAQDFSGVYTQADDPSTILELQVYGGEFVGILLNEGTDSFYVSGFVEYGRIQGIIHLRDAGLQQDMVFVAELSGNYLDMITAFIDQNNNADVANAVQYSFVRSGSQHQDGVWGQGGAWGQTGGGGGYLDRTPFGDIGSDGECSYFFDPESGASVMTGNCG